MNDKQAAEFEATKECNFAISPPGVGRFRVNAFIQQSRVGMVLRTITTDIPKFDDLGLPPVARETRALPPGSRILQRHHSPPGVTRRLIIARRSTAGWRYAG